MEPFGAVCDYLDFSKLLYFNNRLFSDGENTLLLLTFCDIF